MKTMLRKTARVNKGGPSGIVISLIVHAAAFFIAGLFVVFTVLPKSPPKFEPAPPIERPKMRLKKPKVKIRKSAQPKPSSRIVAKVKTAKMPEIQIPDVVGTGEGLLGGMAIGGDFMEPPEITTSLLGSSESFGSDLVGSYYDLKRKRNGNVNTIDRDIYYEIINKFLKSGWDRSILSKYHRLPSKMYLTALVVPVVPSFYAPVAFGDRDASEGRYWLVHYKGTISHKDDITFRFWAAADFVLIVRINGEIVVASTWDTRNIWFYSHERIVSDMWTPTSPEHRQHVFGRSALASVGDWITLKAGEQCDMELIVSDEGGLAAAYLMVEEKGVDYELGAQGCPILPVFRTAKLSYDQLAAISEFLPSDENICLTNGPIFNDY
jgi:hypothetical protein